MTAIRKLLNPLPEVKGSDSEFEPHPEAGGSKRDDTSTAQVRKKQKICKDAAVFTHAPIRGECRYPPDEHQDALLSAQHQQFEVYPMGEIADYPRHIPYNSEKKTLLGRTGRECLEVFQYQFKVPGDDTTYCMLWDYNIGLVRTTPLFKCTGHSKTTPAKMLNRNPGLRDICHSITGGSLVAQGYWIPYEAAKAVAATFCWSIRYALTPVFGVDFPELCVPPDSERHGEMIIDPAITKRCTEQAARYCEMEKEAASQAGPGTPGPLTPDTPTFPRLKHCDATLIRSAASPHSSDLSNDDGYSVMSPASNYRNAWTPANTPRSTPHQALPQNLFPNVGSTFKPVSRRHASPPAVSPKTRRSGIDEAYDGDRSSDDDADKGPGGDQSSASPMDLKVAYLLSSLKSHGKTDDVRKRRAST